MEEKPAEKILLYSYRKVWRIEKKLYAIQNFALPVPIDPWQLLYFGVAWVICNLIIGSIPGFKAIPVVIRSVLIPMAMARFAMTKRLDGKTPLRYFAGMFIYLLTEYGKCLEHFKSVPQESKTLKFDWNCSMRR